MDETPEEIQSNVERQFDVELAAIRALDVTSDRLLDLWPQRGMRIEADRILAMAIARGVTTFKGAISLIEHGFGREAQMLNRSLFEGVAVAQWVSSNPEVAAKRFALANEHELHVAREKVEGLHPDLELPKLPGELGAEKLEEAQKLFGQDNQRLWTGHRHIWDLLQDIEDQWKEEPGRSALFSLLKHEHGRNTKEMHATASAIFGLALDPAAIGPDGRPGISVRVGPGPDSLGDALMGAFFNHGNLLSLLVDHFELGAEAEATLVQVTAENQYAFASVDPEDARNVSRNDPCPCGSGKKFKNCHWDRVRRAL